MITLRDMIETLYRRREQYGGYMRHLIDVWHKIANEPDTKTPLGDRLGHNSVRFIERAYWGK